ncbi:unnamed protein product [Dovyalis caffra]|uniref:Uncharacterized protein n=1 Tax=Dovyalis caffra TaxID=77055 RepID=A0AAV1QYC8_9ROSI|nr:unnamed protein product [Dovyalis caffra]
MGIWDHITSTADSVNRHAITPAKNICWTSYSYGRAAVTTIDTAIRGNAIPKLNQQLQDKETRSMMGHLATNCVKNAAVFAARESVKSVPGGGPIYDIVSKSIAKTEERVMNDYKEKTNKLEAELKELKKEINELKRLGPQYEADNERSTATVDCYEQPKMVNKKQGVGVRNFMYRQQPDSAMRCFMMEGFVAVFDGVEYEN